MANYSSGGSKALKFVGGFQLLQKIGQGGMGTVFKARQVSLDREVALKILPPKIAQKDAVFVERFFREARTSAKLNHPCIVQGIEVGKDEETGLYYFAMEYVDGPTVKQLIHERKIVDELTTLKIIKGVCEALICAHKAGIIHRDIKPDNILLTSTGDPKLADLGLARLMMDSDSDSQGPMDGTGAQGGADLTQAGSAVGTPSYMAPEQIRGQSEDLDARTDLYELGATWFHMVTGRPPYKADGAQKVMEMHLVAPVPSARALNPEVTEATSRTISELLQKDRDRRIQSAELLLVRIEKLMNLSATAKHSAVDPRRTGGYVSVGEGTRVSTREHKMSGKRSGVTAFKRRDLTWLYGSLASITVLGVVAFFALGGASGGGQGDDNTVAAGVKEVSEIKVRTVIPAAATTTATRGSASVNTSLDEVAAGWPPLKKVLERARQTPDAYRTLLEMMHVAEKEASALVISRIRDECAGLEMAQQKAFDTVFEERFAQASALASQRDFVAAIKLFETEKFSSELLSESALSTVRRVHSDFKSRALTDYNTVLEPEFITELEAADRDEQRLKNLRQKIEQSSIKYGHKSITERLAGLRKRVDEALVAAKLPLPVPKDVAPIAAPASPENAEPKAVVLKPNPKVPEVSKVVEPIPEPKNKKRRPDPREVSEWKAKFLPRAEAKLHQLEVKQSFSQAFDVAYKMEDYLKTIDLLERAAHEKNFSGRDNDVWLAAMVWEVGLLIPQSNAQRLDVLVKTWKTKALAAIENFKADEKENRWTRWDTPHDLAKVEDREAFFKSWQKPLIEDLKKMELAGEDDPKYLWDLARRYYDERKPYVPLRYMSVLLKLRAWHPDFPQVASGEVQTRLARLLSDQLWLPQEALVEASCAVDKYAKHGAVAGGEMCWIQAESNLALAREQRMNKDAAEFYAEAKKYYEQYRDKFPAANNNKIHHTNHQSECQRKLDDVNSNLDKKKSHN